MATEENYTYYSNTTATASSFVTGSGTYNWTTTDPFTYHFVESSPESQSLNYHPSDLPLDFEFIQGKAKGAKFLVSYAFKKSKDPVVFVKNKKDMLLLVSRLWNDEKVDRKTIMVHQISKQFKPKMVKKMEKVVKEVEGVELQSI